MGKTVASMFSKFNIDLSNGSLLYEIKMVIFSSCISLETGNFLCIGRTNKKRHLREKNSIRNIQYFDTNLSS